jgi:hypothetical protein
MLEYMGVCFVCSIAILCLTFIEPEPSGDIPAFTKFSYIVFMIPLVPIFLLFFLTIKVARDD